MIVGYRAATKLQHFRDTTILQSPREYYPWIWIDMLGNMIVKFMKDSAYYLCIRDN